MKMIKNIQRNSILVFAFFISLVQAGTDGTIRGKVTDVDKNSLPGAQVFITELSIGAVADVNGNYIILNVPVGAYDVIVMMMGYLTNVIWRVLYLDIYFNDKILIIYSHIYYCI